MLNYIRGDNNGKNTYFFATISYFRQFGELFYQIYKFQERLFSSDRPAVD